MANYVTIELDTTAPANPTVTLEGGANFATQQLITVGISGSTGYQMKIWGDVDPTYNASINTTEGTSSWITFNASQQIKLSSAESLKTINIRLRDDVHNESGIGSDTITLDTSIPVVTATADVSKVSEITGKNIVSVSFTSDVAFVEYKVKVVTITGATHDTGVQLPTTAGSTNVSATGSFPANTAIVSQIRGTDLKTASAGDGSKIIKVFVRDQAGLWSV